MNKDQLKNNSNISKACEPLKKTALFPGRFAPAHKAHINIIKDLSEQFDKVVVGIGSCYEAGTERHPLLAVFREKIILSSIRSAGIDEGKVDIVHLQDFETFEEWIEHVSNIANQKGVTHFVTGNEKDILNVLDEKNITLPFEFINPEDESAFGYHATDLRSAIIKGDYDKFKEIASIGTIQLMGNIGGFSGIRSAIENNGTKFVPGRQAVDVVFIVTNEVDAPGGRKIKRNFVLCGRRQDDKKDFPGYLAFPGGGIDDYESPINAALRELEEETGIDIDLLDNSIEPAHILIKAEGKKVIEEMRFLKLFSSFDERLAGSKGGSSQVFGVHLHDNPEIFKNIIKSNSDLKDVGFYPLGYVKEEGLAFQQDEMLELALQQFKLV